MLRISKVNIEYILLSILFLWIALCSFFNFGILAGIVYLFFVIIISRYSSRASFGLLFCLLYLSLQSLNIPNGYVIATMIITIMNFNKVFSIKNSEIFRKIVVIYFFYILFRFCTILIARDTDLFFSYIINDLIVFINVYIAINLISSIDDINFLGKVIGWIGVFASILGFLYFSFNDIAYINKMLVNTNLAQKAMLSDSQMIQTWLRWIPASKEPNFWGLSLLLPLGYWAFKISQKTSFLSFLCLTITLLGIFGSYSRSSLLIATFIVIYALFNSKKSYFILSLIVLSFFAFGLYFYLPSIIDRILTIQESISESGGSYRFQLWGEAIDNFILHPIWGVGAGQTKLYSLIGLESHNLYLQILSETGFIGFIIFSILWFKPLYEMKKLYKGQNFFFYSLIGYSINLLTVSGFDLRLPLYVFIMFYVYKSVYNRENKELFIK